MGSVPRRYTSRVALFSREVISACSASTSSCVPAWATWQVLLMDHRVRPAGRQGSGRGSAGSLHERGELTAPQGCTPRVAAVGRGMAGGRGPCCR